MGRSMNLLECLTSRYCAHSSSWDLSKNQLQKVLSSQSFSSYQKLYGHKSDFKSTRLRRNFSCSITWSVRRRVLASSRKTMPCITNKLTRCCMLCLNCKWTFSKQWLIRSKDKTLQEWAKLATVCLMSPLLDISARYQSIPIKNIQWGKQLVKLQRFRTQESNQ